MSLRELQQYWPVDFPTVSQETWEKIVLYQSLLHKWQKAINLVAPSTLQQSGLRHFIDSMQLLPYIQGGSLLYDLGSGAGFPGLVLAICRPDLQVHLIESDQRKGSFLRTVSRETGANVIIHTARIEALDLPPPDFITARALASLDSLLGYTEKWWRADSEPGHIFLKGAQVDQEVKEASKIFSFSLSTAPSLSDPQGRILVIDQVRRI